MSKYIFALLVFISPVHADEWNRADTYREGTYLAFHTIDWLQTRGLAHNNWPDGRYETNPVLGKYPSVAKLDAHYAFTSLGHLYIATLLPEKYRHVWQYIAIIDAGSAVICNHRLGVRIQF